MTTYKQIAQAASEAHSYSLQFGPLNFNEDTYAKALAALCKKEGHAKALPKFEAKQNKANVETDKMSVAIHSFLRTNGPSTSAKITEKMGVTSNVIGAYLRSMRDDGIVKSERLNKKQNIWSIKRTGRKSNLDVEIMDILRKKNGKMTTAQISEIVKKGKDTVGRRLFVLFSEGYVERARLNKNDRYFYIIANDVK